jgi:dihydrofolate reductase
MGSIKAGLFISLDGVIEPPETWHFDYWSDEMGAAVGELMSNDGMLLGRRTYEGFAEYWPKADPDDPMTAQMNGAQKYVVSRTLTEATWENSTLVTGDVKAGLTELKRDKHLGTTGSAVLVAWMVEQELVDELHLFVHPVVIGQGQKLFTEGAKVPLRLVSSTTFETGVVHLVYGPATS